MYTKQELLEMDIEIKNLFSLEHTRAAALFEGLKRPWEALPSIGDMIRKIGAALPEEEFDHPAEDVWIAKDAKVWPTAWITPDSGAGR